MLAVWTPGLIGNFPMIRLLSGREYRSLFCYKHHTVPGRGHCTFQTLGGSLWPKADHLTIVWLQGKERLSICQDESPNNIPWKCLVFNKMGLLVKLKHSVYHCDHVTWSAPCVHIPGPYPDFPLCIWTAQRQHLLRRPTEWGGKPSTAAPTGTLFKASGMRGLHQT